MDALLFGCLPARSGQVSLSGHDTYQFLDSLVVRISACHVEGPGSIPGRGGTFLLKTCAIVLVLRSLPGPCFKGQMPG